MEEDNFDGLDETAPGDDVLQVVECSDGVTIRGVAGALGLSTEEAKERSAVLKRAAGSRSWMGCG